MATFNRRSADKRLQQNESELLKDLKSSSVRNVGNYVLGKTIGEGTFGKVKTAIHKLVGEQVAVKIVDKVHAPVVIREIETWKRLRHPNIAQLFEVLTTETKIYMVMEYVSGGEIFHHVEEHGAIGEVESRRLFKQLLNAMKYCHDKKLVHRDLKLENILLDEHVNIKLIDFGFTREYESKTKLLDTYCGSTAYAAPVNLIFEMIAGHKYSGPEADIWSLGVILYTILCGYLPFDDDNEARIHSKIMSLEYELPEHLSDDAKDLIRKILQLDPKQRITIEDMLSHRWFKIHKITSFSFSSAENVSEVTEERLKCSQTIPALTVRVPTDDSINFSPTKESPSGKRNNHVLEYLSQRTMEEKLLLYHLALLGFDTSGILKSVESESCDQSCGIFYLLLTKFQNNPSLNNSALLSALSNPAFGYDENLIIAAKNHSYLSPSSINTDHDDLETSSLNVDTSLPSAFQQIINDRMLTMLQMASSSSANNSGHFNRFSNIIPGNIGFSSEPSLTEHVRRKSINEMAPEAVGNYYGYLASWAQKSAILSHEKPSSTVPSPSLSREFSPMSKSGVTLFSSPLSPSTNHIEQIHPGVNRRSSASEVQSSPLRSPKFSTRRSTISKFSPLKNGDETLSEVREFRDRQGSKKQATISEEAEADDKKGHEKNSSSAIGKLFKSRGFASKKVDISNYELNALKTQIKDDQGDAEPHNFIHEEEEEDDDEDGVHTVKKTITTVETQSQNDGVLEPHRRVVSRQSSKSSISEERDGVRVLKTMNEETMTIHESGKRITKIIKEERTEHQFKQ